MEKKVLLKELVDTGTNLRKQIISKVRVSDQGVYPIGEIWDANTTINTIVDGASIAFDTLKEVEEKLEEHDAQIAAEVARATAAEQAEENRAKSVENNLQSTKANKSDVYTKTEIDNKIGDLGTRYTEVSNSFDYIHDEASWNASYTNGGLKLYYQWADEATKPYKEDLWNTVENRAANINDVKVDPETGEKMVDENGSYIYENCIRCWMGALNAPGAKYPWIVPYFTTDVNSKIIFSYEGKDNVRPWGDKIFGKGNDHKEWGCASIPEELGEEFILDEHGETTFDLNKFKMILEYVNPVPYSVKTYIEDMIRNISGQGGQLGPDTVSTVEILDGTIQMQDLADDLKNKL